MDSAKVDLVGQVNHYLAELDEAGATYATLVGKEMALEDGRHKVKQGAVLRLIQLENPTQPGKNYSATTAESMATADEEYSRYLSAQRDVVVAKNLAYTRLKTLTLQARLAIALVERERKVVVL